jgi:uncharacterized membrane protein
MGRLDELLHPSDQRTILLAIGAADRRSSIALHVHVEATCRYPEARARQLLHALKIGRPHRRSGVLLLLLVEERRCVVVVDAPVQPVERTSVWQDVVNHLTIDLRHGKMGQGIADALNRFSHILAGHFPGRGIEVHG